MKNALIIILYDHTWEHTADYATQTCNFFCAENIVVGILLKDALSIKELLTSRSWTGLWKKRGKNFYTITPLYFIPFRRYSFICYLNNILNIFLIKFFLFLTSKSVSSRKKIVWVYNPAHYTEANLLKGNGLLVYDCVDYHHKSHAIVQERNLLRTSDYVFVNSRVLYDLYHPFRTDIHIVPLGFDYKSFRMLQNKKKSNRDVTPVIGYIGGINSRLNYSLLQKVASLCPHLKFVFIGPIQYHEKYEVFETMIRPQISALFQLNNVTYFGAVPKRAIGEYIQQFSVCMIPYDVSLPFNINCFPMKVLEYFYFGKPVISTPIKELRAYASFIQLEKNPTMWKRSIEHVLHTSWGEDKQKKQRDIALSNSWDHKFQTINAIIEQQIQ